MFGVTLALYILNQKALLPKPLSAVVSKLLFWPTMPITVARRIGEWTSVIDETVIMGGAPFGFASYPEQLYDENVRGVINMCEEYAGPQSAYDELQMTQLRLPTTDHFIPTVMDLERAVRFIHKNQLLGNRVYVHCRAGHGRSAAAVFAWLLYKNPNVDRQSLNRQFGTLRNVKQTLWKAPEIIEFHEKLLRGVDVCKEE
jgi:atypical dual specificity phosphatase